LIVKTTDLSESFQKLASNEMITRKEFTQKMELIDQIDQVNKIPIKLSINLLLF
jgi:hypothetical protein